MKLTECGLRKELLVYAADNQERVQTFLSEWNERLAHGIGMPQHLWYDLFGAQLVNGTSRKLIQSVCAGDNHIEIYAALHVSQENPFRTECVYEIPWGGSTIRFPLGEEGQILKLIEAEVSN